MQDGMHTPRALTVSSVTYGADHRSVVLTLSDGADIDIPVSDFDIRGGHGPLDPPTAVIEIPLRGVQAAL